MPIFLFFSPLSASSYIKLPVKLRDLMKGLINNKNNDNKCFLWCHIKYLSPLKIHPERITKEDRYVINALDYKGIGFPVSKKDLTRLKRKIIFALMCFVMKII